MEKFEIHDAEYYQKFCDLPNDGWLDLPEKLSNACGQYKFERDGERGLLFAVLSANYMERYGNDGFFALQGPIDWKETEKLIDLLYKCIHNNKQWSYYYPEWYSIMVAFR